MATESRDVSATPRWSRFLPVIYVAMILFSVGAFLLIRSVGTMLTAPIAELPTADIGRPTEGKIDVVPHVLATLTAVIVLGHLLGRLARVLGQPPVIGEVLAGILLGPSLLGVIAPDVMHRMIPDTTQDPHGRVIAALKAIAELGVVMYMFLVGLELNAATLKAKARSTVLISHASIVAPFLMGANLALWLYPLLSHRGVPFTSFSLFMGAALSVTAFPVLARILADRGLDKTEVGVIALGCAAADDVTAWCLLALVVGVAQAELGQALLVFGLALAFIALMFLVVRPVLTRVIRQWDRGTLPASVLPGMLACVLVSALISDRIGIHAVFGAFLLGVMIPHDSRAAEEFTRKLKDVVTILLLPAFFALTGLRTEIGLIDDAYDWLICVAIIVVATLGKLGGTFVAARCTGYDSRTAAALGTMMNTRGLMGLIVLDMGLQMGVISQTLFAMMVIMALVTTMMTAPLLKRLM